MVKSVCKMLWIMFWVKVSRDWRGRVARKFVWGDVRSFRVLDAW